MGCDAVPQIFQHVGHVPLTPHDVLHRIGIFVIKSAHAQRIGVIYDGGREPHAFGEVMGGQTAAGHRAGEKVHITQPLETAARTARHLDATRGQAEVSAELLVIRSDFWALRMSDEERHPVALVERGTDPGKVDGVV